MSDVATNIKGLSHEELLGLMTAQTPLGEARRQFSYAMAAIEQTAQQSRPLDIYRLRRMEFEAAQKIAKALGVIV